MAKKRIMVVDDEVDFLKMVKMNLEESGAYEVLTLTNGKDIIHQVHRFDPDIILLDLLMPTLGGIEVCEMLNKDQLGLKVPIIVVSALSKEEDKIMAYKKGVVDFLVKPIGKDELIAKIEKYLEFKKDK